MKKKEILLAFLICIGHASSVKGQIGINTDSPKSTLDIQGSTEANQVAGIQAPRLTLAALTSKGNTLYGTSQKGVFIFITNVSGGNNTGQRVNISSPGYYYFDGSLWQKLGASQPLESYGDIKYSFNITDHNGWYLLNGRTINSLPASIQSIATSLGFTTSLPDARDRVLKTKTGTEALGGIGGSNTLTITQSNLPNVTLSANISATSGNGGAAHTHTFSGTSASGGAAHTHTYSGTSTSNGAAHSHTISNGTSASGGAAHTHPYSGTSNNTGAHTHTYTAPPRQNTMDRGGGASAISVDNASSVIQTAGAHTHSFNATSTNTSHTHTFSGTSASTTHTHTFGATSTGNTHTHTLNGTSDSEGAHIHTVNGTATLPLGGSGSALNNRSAYLVINAFVYLGN